MTAILRRLTARTGIIGLFGSRTRHHRHRCTATAALLVLLSSAIASVVFTAGPAQATAFTCTGYGWITVPYTHIASSRWCGQTNGTGRYVSSVGGGFTALIAGVYLCDTRMKVEFFNDYGSSVATYYSGVHTGCWQAGGVFAINGINRNFPKGYVRISLLSYGAEQAAVQQNIKP
jgi:hypothetical protein